MPDEATDRNLLDHGGGKGDKDRSPGWRKNYAEVDFHRGVFLGMDLAGEAANGFARRGNKLVKVYGAGKQAIFREPQLRSCRLCCSNSGG